MHRLGQGDQNNFLTDQMSRFWPSSRVRAPKGPKKDHFDALSIDFPAKVADRHHASKMRPKARWTPRSTTTAPDKMVRMPSAALGDVCDLGRSPNRCSNRSLVRQRRSERRMMCGRIFDACDGDRPPWPKNRSTKRPNGLFGALLGP